MTKVKILVCCHKKDVMATQEPYFPIHVGKAISDVDLLIQGDDTGDNISVKNRNYCELTGMYWAWKNMKDVDVIGLCHYRRYFDFHGQCSAMRYLEVVRTDKFASLDLSIPDNIIKEVMNGKAVVAKTKYYPYSLHADYCCCHISDDYRTLEKYIKETQPKNVRRAFYHVMNQNNGLIHYNMFLMTFQMFDKYCQWIFKVLGDMEKLIDISNYTPFQARIWGYIAERLFNVWLEAEGITLIQRPVLWITDDAKPESTFHQWQYTLRTRLAFELAKGRRNQIDDE